ncbi:MAG: hypothetical protein K5922_08780 [Clostridiales bacterium]|nr:hypothetical protein [Clostridiales bacterium]
MKTYEELVREYRKRQRDTVVDTIATGLTYMDEIAVDTGLLEETGILTELMENVAGVLPFAIITVSEGSKILMKKKPGKTGVKDGAFRMVKTGAAMGVGAAVMGTAGFWAAIPVTMGVRALFDRYRSKTLTGHRVQSRIERLRELNRFIRDEETERSEELPVREHVTFAAEGSVE